MKTYIRFIILLGIVLIFTLSTKSEDPPKEKSKKDIVVDTTIIQKEQMVLNKSRSVQLNAWDSLLIKQDSLIKKK